MNTLANSKITFIAITAKPPNEETFAKVLIPREAAQVTNTTHRMASNPIVMVEFIPNSDQLPVVS